MMALSFETTLDKKVMAEVIATSEQLRLAQTRALRSVARTLTSYSRAYVAKRTGISQRRLSLRVYESLSAEGDEATLWFGSRDVPVDTLGTVSQSRAGARAGRIFRRKAFKMLASSGKELIFIRAASPHVTESGYDSHLYGNNGVRARMGAGRYPLRRAVVPIDNEVAAAMAELDGMAARLYNKALGKELNYEIFVKGD